MTDVQAIIDKYSDNSAKDKPIDNLDQINEVFTPEGTIHDLINRLEAKKDTEFG